MKKILAICLVLVMLLSLAPLAQANDGIPVFLNGKAIEKEGIIVNDRTFLPVRALCEALGYEVDWVDDTKSVIIGTAPEKTEKTDAVNIYLDGEKMENAEAIIVSDFTYLPVRALCEALGKNVEWNNEKREVYVTDKASDDDPFNGKYFRLKHVATGRYLCVEYAKTDDGAKVVVANRDDSNSNQVWGFTAMDEGFYKIFNQNSKKSIDVGAFSTVAGAELTQYTSNGGTNQQVKPVKNADGTYTLVIRHSNLAITATDRFTTQEELTNDDTQKFEAEYVGQTPMGNLKESAGYKALDDVTRERFDSFVYTSLPFGARVQNEVENKLIMSDYYNISEEEQIKVLKDCLTITVYGQVDFGEILPDKEKAKYEIKSKTYKDSYDVWRGTMLPVWMYEVEMAGDVEGQVHTWTMISTVEDSSVVTDAINALSRFPYAIRHHINRLIYRTDNANSYNGGGDTIWIRLNWIPDEKRIAHTLAHELGHVLDSNLTSESALWDRARANDMVPMSSYGNSNRAEDLAEFSRMFNVLRTDEAALKELQKVYPNRFAAYAALLFTSDPVYYAHYKNYYEETMKFDDDDKAPFYCQISLPGTNLVLTQKDSAKGSVVTFEENTNADNQIWRIREWQGKKAVFNKATGLCINVPGNSSDSGKNLIVWNGGKGGNELMTMTQVEGNKYTFTFAHSNLYLSAESGKAGAKAIQINTKSEVVVTEVK
ncbi:MAG: RICIN domain-containing protein [Clostridia bacterium]|nr:RICIN domain-containing protein [Clostridia bacterium]